MSKEIIKKIVIEIAGKEISLTPKQANELCDALMSHLGKHGYSYTPYWYPYNNGTWTATNQIDAFGIDPSRTDYGKIVIN